MLTKEQKRTRNYSLHLSSQQNELSTNDPAVLIESTGSSATFLVTITNILYVIVIIK